MFNKILYRLAQTKQRLSYASSWFGILGMPLLIVDLLQKKLMLYHINVSFIILTITTLIFLIVAGYTAEKTGLIEAENKWAWKQQTAMKKSLKK